jgi:hypothetical protein
MKYLLSMTFIMAAALSTYGQAAAPPATPCTVKAAPVIRGVKLGMTTNDALTMFPGSRDNEFVKSALAATESSASFGVTSFSLFPIEYAGKERFTGISYFHFIFVDGRLVQYGVEYDHPPWPHTEDFINKIAGAFQLPTAENWTQGQGYRALDCDGFRLRASVSNRRGSLGVETGDDPYKIQGERRAKAEEEERRVFKP